MEVKTIGNATLVVKNNSSTLLVTDPWFDEHDCYFGSWRLSHEIPKKIKEEALAAKYIFISHFHPDHLNLKTLRLFKNTSKIILGQQVSDRIPNQLRNIGFDVIVLPIRKWISLDKHCNIIMFTDEKQDTTILIEIIHGKHKTLLVNLNDSSGCGCSKEICSISRQYKNSILLHLAGYGDADMINLWDLEKNIKIKSPCDDFTPIGSTYNSSMKDHDCNICIPFSSAHQYQRVDSWWARKYSNDLDKDHFNGFNQTSNKRLFTSFQKINFDIDNEYPFFQDIKPKKLLINQPVDCKVFGDDWEDKMKKDDHKLINEYFHSISYLKTKYDSISVQFNKDIHVCKLNQKSRYGREILFQSPRRSFIYSIRNNTFDDLLIANFMKTYLKGSYNLSYPRFTFFVGKLADNAYSKSKQEIDEAFSYYNQDRRMDDKIVNKYRNLILMIKSQILSPGLRSFVKKIFYKFR